VANLDNLMALQRKSQCQDMSRVVVCLQTSPRAVLSMRIVFVFATAQKSERQLEVSPLFDP
jgi:hypothetical protein